VIRNAGMHVYVHVPLLEESPDIILAAVDALAAAIWAHASQSDSCWEDAWLLI
jgi:hypothetical protein